MLGFSNPKEPYNDDGPKDVRQNEDVLTVITVSHHPGDGADQKRSQHTHQEKAAYRKSRLGEFYNQSGRGNQVEPVTQQTDDLAKPQVTKIGIASNQLPVTYGSMSLGSCRVQQDLPVSCIRAFVVRCRFAPSQAGSCFALRRL